VFRISRFWYARSEKRLKALGMFEMLLVPVQWRSFCSRAQTASMAAPPSPFAWID
jgi:hypothetical protein